MSEKTVFGVPRELKIDQICALFVRLSAVLADRINVFTASFADVMNYVELVFRDEDDTELPARAQSVDWYAYNKGKFGSATEEQTQMTGKDGVPSVRHLVGLLNANNAKGVLVNGQGSLAKMLRRVYELDRGAFRSLYGDPSAQDFDTFRCRVVALYWPLVQLYFMASEANLKETIAIENPFSFAGLQQMMKIAYDLADWNDLEASFRHAEELVDARMVRAEQKAAEAKAKARSFRIPFADGDGSRQCWFIETDDRLVPARFLELFGQQTGVLIVRRTDTKQYFVFCTGQQNFGPLQSALEKADPSSEWHLEQKGTQSPMLLNGSASRAAAVSQLKPQELIDLVRSHVRYQLAHKQRPSGVRNDFRRY